MADLVTLAKAQEFLNIQDTEATAIELAAVIKAVTRVVEREVGPVLPRTVTSVVEVRGGRAVLPSDNITAVDSITGSDGAIDTAGFTYEHSVLTGADALPEGTVTVVYQVGMPTVPENIQYGALEVLKLAWAAQLNETLPAFLLSYRASAWFEPDMVLPGFS